MCQGFTNEPGVFYNAKKEIQPPNRRYIVFVLKKQTSQLKGLPKVWADAL